MDIAALGLSVDSKQVEQATQALNKFAASGKQAETATKGISSAQGGMSREMTTAVNQANRLNRQIVEGERVAKLSRHAMQNLAFQLNDVATMAALGADPMRILASQGGQVYQTLSMQPGGVGSAVAALGRQLSALLTPMRLAGAGFGILGATAFASMLRAESSIAATERALIGVGQASGVTAAQIRAMSLAAADAGTNTVSNAAEFATALASTGRINAEIISQSLQVSKALEKAYGDEAGQQLAKALSDPLKGVEALQKRLLAFDDTTKETIKSLARQGDTLGAQRLIMENVTRSLDGAAAATSRWESAWSNLSRTTSSYFNELGDFLRKSTGGATLEEAAEAARKRQERGPLRFKLPGQERDDRSTILEANLAAYDRLQAALRQRADDVANLARRVYPGVDDLRQMVDLHKRLKDASADDQITSRLSTETRVALERANEMMALKVRHHKTAVEVAREDLELAERSATARSAGQRAAIEYAQIQSRLLREGRADAHEMADLARQRVLMAAEVEESRYRMQQVFSDRENLDRSKMELALVSQSSIAAAGLRAEFDAITEAKRRAHETGGVVSAIDVERAARLRSEAEGATAALIRVHMQRELMFERDQMGRSDREQNVYDRLDAAGLLTNGQIVGAQAEMLSQQIRFNEVMKITQDSSKDFISNFVKDMRNGVDATEALGNAMNRLSDKLMDLALDQGISAALAPFSSAVASGATGAAGGLLGGMLIPGVLHDGGIVGSGNYPHRVVPGSLFAGAKRYHNGGVIGIDEVPAILQKGEGVLSRNQVKALANSGQKADPVINITTNVDARGATVDAVKALEQALAARDANLPEQIRQGVRDTFDRGMI